MRTELRKKKNAKTTTEKMRVHGTTAAYNGKHVKVVHTSLTSSDILRKADSKMGSMSLSLSARSRTK